MLVALSISGYAGEYCLLAVFLNDNREKHWHSQWHPAIDYIHENPVRRNMCRRAIDWKWSSAVWYQGEPSQQQVPELPLIHGLRPGTLDG